ncbi:hypothetical protein KBB08_01635 [Candidatus Gracilibacteria bacterium]|nr:hypothetical protein [Candidatus Gracilibacteria bacterium]
MQRRYHNYIIITLLACLITGIVSYSNLGIGQAELDSSDTTTNHFWVVVQTSDNETIGPLLDRYINDITPILSGKYPDIVIEKKIISLQPGTTTNQQVYSIANTLENGYFHSKLQGVLLVNLPLARVEKAGINQSSLLPYGDFEHKYFVFDSSSDNFAAQQQVTDIEPEILLGYLPDLGPSGFQAYFDANHDYYSGATTYNRALFSNDQIHDDELWQNFATSIVSPTGTTPFNLKSYTDVLASSEKNWQDTLQQTKRWRSLPSVNTNSIRARLDGWYDEPALATITNLLPLVGSQFLGFSDTEIATQRALDENTMGGFLQQIGVFDSSVAINYRFFTTTPVSTSNNNVCTTSNPFPDPRSETIQILKNQFTALRNWITSIPRGSLLAKAEAANTVFVNGTPVGQYFVIRPGSLVRSISDEPLTIQTILIDPSTVAQPLTIPRGGFNHPGILEGSDEGIASWGAIEISDEQIDELLAWRYFLNPNDRAIYFAKNHLPPINQFSTLPNTFEVVNNTLSPERAQFLTRDCLQSADASSKSILSLFTGFVSLSPVLNTSAAWQELASGRSLAAIVVGGETTSAKVSFDAAPRQQYAGISSPPSLVNWASGAMLGEAIQSGLNENVALLGDPCLTLPR